ncbi:MAG: FHA domain-containing protein [Ilumatobacteraceae bacterium]
MSYVHCNQCGHRNPPDSNFCSSCGSPLDNLADRTITLDPRRSAAGLARLPTTTSSCPVGDIEPGTAVLIVRAGAQAGSRFTLKDGGVTQLGRHPDSDISLDDITVSRRHAEIEHSPEGYVARDAGSLNGTYINQERKDSGPLHHGDELQIGKFRLVFFERTDG